MKTILVGYRFEDHISNSLISKESEIDIFDMLDIRIMTPKGYNLIIWENDTFLCPVKDKGSVLIYVSEGTIGDSLSDVFKMKANAVILVNGSNYDLVDALGNLWCRTSDPIELLNNVLRLYNWTKSSIRKQSIIADSYVPFDVRTAPDLKRFCDVIKTVSSLVENERGGRYFGNASTRCSKMFPSIRRRKNNGKSSLGDYILVSKRNVSKEKIEPEDFVVAKLNISLQDSNPNMIMYFGEDKPSVDTPSQIWLYNEYPNINYMIHGHAYVNSDFLGVNLINTTDEYCSCGDLREVTQIKKIVRQSDCDFFIINLINHGFIIATETLETMENFVNHKDTHFVYRNIGEEIVNI